jgi:CubicO group peptidase (beta-lactamase class C family)
MNRVRTVCFAVACLLLLPTPWRAQQANSLPTETIQKIEALVSDEMAKQKIPGLSLAIAVDHQLRYSKAFGLADLENSVLVKTSTVFRTASVAKPMTATAVMQLVESGKLDLDAPIRKYCPAFPEKNWPVTARQLLGHLGGVRHYQKPGEAVGTEHFYSIADSLKLFKDDPLLHEPGTQYHYTTYGYSLLGCAIEGASGTPYEQYVQERVFGPAGMTRTRSDNHFVLMTDRARGYMVLRERDYNQLPDPVKAQVKVGQVFNAPLHDTSMKIPGGGLVSTAEDLVRFALTFQTGVLVKPETRQQMWTAQKTRSGEATNYGLGWGIARSKSGLLQISHGGGQAGTSSFLLLLPEKGIVVAVMANLEGAEWPPILRGIIEILIPPSS